MDKVFVRSPYNYDMMAISNSTGLECLDVSRTVQDGKEDADINTIVRRFGLTGQLPDNLRPPQYGDFTGVSDYQSALNAVLEAEAGFLEMPAETRAKFNNDPQLFLEFCSDVKNRDEMKKLGLLVPDVVTPTVNIGNFPVAEPPK